VNAPSLPQRLLQRLLQPRLLTVLLALVLLGLGLAGERLNDQRHQLALRAEVLGRLVELRERLNSELVSDLQLVRGLVSVINLDPGLDQARFEKAVQPLLGGRTHLRNVGAAPDMVIRLMVPLAGNERAIGLDYRQTPGQAEAAERARLTRQVVLAGPLPLAQGGRGLIARLPVYLRDTDGGERFWGLVSAVIDSDKLFRSAGLLDEALDVEVAIRGVDASGAAGAVFLGRPQIFQQSPVLAEVMLPQGSWQMAALPRGGWRAHAASLWGLRAAYALLAAGVLAAFIGLVRSRERAEAALARSVRDVAARKDAEAELARHRDHLEEQVSQRTAQLAAAKEAAEAASVAKTLFLANMSHEIRTPLNAITGMAYLIRHAGVSVEQARRLDTLEAASRHLLQVINAILDLSKIESGRFELARQPVDPQALVDEVGQMLRDTVQARGLRWVSQVQVMPQPLLGDATRLQQALLNYAANAVRFTSAGEVVVRVRTEAETAERLCLHVEVQDTGVGIDEATLARLFNAFEQADNSYTRQHGGTGLGLIITRRLAERMGGTAGAESEPGRGSRFWFTAWLDKGPDPAAAAAAQAAPSPAHAAEPPAPRRVLLVEDDQVNRTIAAFLLQDLGHHVDLAEDGLQAVAMAAATRYDLILMDVQMPRMDGLEATRRIRAAGGGDGEPHVPIIAITANAFDQDRQACLDAGMDDFVAKPIEPEALRERLRHWLQAR
jgi:sensor domain CHASE-containing protein/CheY-like chemotaxis protein